MPNNMSGALVKLIAAANEPYGVLLPLFNR